MKKISYLLSFVFFLNMNCLFSQDTIPPYLKTKVVPLFKLLKANDSLFYQKFNIPKNKQTLIILFSPDCDHCQTETKAITENIKSFEKTNIIMASWMSYADIKKFYYDYDLNKHENIICGKDMAYLLPPFYKASTIPLIALYDKKGRFKKIFTGTVDIQKIIAAL